MFNGRFNPKVALGNDINMRIFSKICFQQKPLLSIRYYWDIHVERVDQLSGKNVIIFHIFRMGKRIFNVIKTIFVINGSTK